MIQALWDRFNWKLSNYLTSSDFCRPHFPPSLQPILYIGVASGQPSQTDAIFLLAQWTSVWETRRWGRLGLSKHSTCKWQCHHLDSFICPKPKTAVSTACPLPVETVRNNNHAKTSLRVLAYFGGFPTVQLRLSCSCAFKRMMQTAEFMFHWAQCREGVVSAS